MVMESACMGVIALCHLYLRRWPFPLLMEGVFFCYVVFFLYPFSSSQKA